MKELIQILEVAQSKHGANSPLTIGHLLNICKIAKDVQTHEQEVAAIKEEKQHWEIMSAINNHGQD